MPPGRKGNTSGVRTELVAEPSHITEIERPGACLRGIRVSGGSRNARAQHVEIVAVNEFVSTEREVGITFGGVRSGIQPHDVGVLVKKCRVHSRGLNPLG